MTRSRRSARQAGTAFETSIVRHLATVVDDRIERRAKTGANDRGDITGWRIHGARIVAECKNHNRLNLAGWVTEAEVERGNDDALVGLVIHKRRGTTDPGDQYVTLTLRDLLALLGHGRDA